jgi:hypothetical protein
MATIKSSRSTTSNPSNRSDCCLEIAAILNELRFDALRAAGLYDEFVALCLRALRQVGNWKIHDRLFNRYLLLSHDELVVDRILGIRYAASLDRLGSLIEENAAQVHQERLGTASIDAVAVNIRNNDQNLIWQAVRITGEDGTVSWYRVNFHDDEEFECEPFDGLDPDRDAQSTIVYRLDDIFFSQLGE